MGAAPAGAGSITPFWVALCWPPIKLNLTISTTSTVGLEGENWKLDTVITTIAALLKVDENNTVASSSVKIFLIKLVLVVKKIGRAIYIFLKAIIGDELRYLGNTRSGKKYPAVKKKRKSRVFLYFIQTQFVL